MNEYVKTEWVDNDSPAISAANLNHIESGVEAVTNAVIALHNAGVSPEQITATITEAVRSSLSNKMDKLSLGSADKIIVSTANGSVQRSTYNVTNADSDFKGDTGATVPQGPAGSNYVLTAADRQAIAQIAMDGLNGNGVAY